MKAFRITSALFALSTFALAGIAFANGRADEPKAQTFTAEQNDFFEKKVRPLIAERCYACHTGKTPKGGLLLDSREAILKGNASGPALVPGNPDSSLLIHVTRYDGAVKMPPGGRLQADEVETLRTWIKMGAPFPGSKAGGVATAGAKPFVLTPEQRQFWSFVPVQKPRVPAVKNKAWVKNPVDAFILSKLEAKGIKPALSADKRTLIRRATFDLIGLPPTPNEIQDFLADKSPNAFEKVVDRLQASVHYGERWGRHWLDVVRYADSNGLDENKAFGYAYRYRDYVVNSFNQDKPYTQFIHEQLAGDLLPFKTEEERSQNLIATGFLVLGPKVLAEQDKPKMVMDIVDEQIEVTSKAFLGLTIACARCHDHKFDPIATKDYYALAGIFKSTRTMANLGFVSEWMERPVPTKADTEAQNAYIAKKKQVESTLDTARRNANAELLTLHYAKAGKYLLAGWDLAERGGATSQADLPRKPGDVLLEAEAYARGNLGRDADNYGKGIGIVHSVTSPNFAEWDFTVPKEGMYQLEMRYGSAEVRPIRLKINDQKVNERACTTNTGSFFPDGQRWEIQGLYRLKAGKNTLRLDQENAIPHIDKILVVPAPEPRQRKNQPRLTAAPDDSLVPEIVAHWASALKSRKDDPIFGALYAFTYLSEENFETEASALAESIAQGKGLPKPPALAITKQFQTLRPKNLSEVFQAYTQLFDEVEARWSAEKQPEKLSDANLETVRKTLHDPNNLFKLPEKAERFYSKEGSETVQNAQKSLDTLNKEAPKLPVAMAVEEGKIENCRVHLRGNTLTLGDEAPRGVVQVLGGERFPKLADNRSGRLELAEWIANKQNPVTARVAVNRIWQYLFSDGLVRTPDNYGLLGDRPVHKELLDWLSATFMEQGWSFKKIQKILLLSNTYQMSGKGDPKADTLDPDNRLFGKKKRKRLEAEPLRDSLLAVSGQLDTTLGGSLLNTPNNDYVTNDQSGNGARYNAPRRSLYLPIIRNALFDMFQTFDYGEPSLVNAQRSSTTIAPQALYQLNSPFAMEQAHKFADAVLKQTLPNDTARLQFAYLTAIGRSPSPQEIARATQYMLKLESALPKSETDAVKRSQRVWTSVCHALMACNEFIYVD